jgi:hypothetical protein
LVAFSEDIAYGAEQKSTQTQRRQYVRFQRARTARTEFLFKKTVDGGALAVSEHEPGGSRLRRVTSSILASVDAPRTASAVLDDAAREELRALGYIE